MSDMFIFLFYAIPCVILVVSGIMLMRHWRAKESHLVWVVGVILVVLGATVGVVVLLSTALSIPLSAWW